jgi:hypothetical protein
MVMLHRDLSAVSTSALESHDTPKPTTPPHLPLPPDAMLFQQLRQVMCGRVVERLDKHRVPPDLDTGRGVHLTPVRYDLRIASILHVAKHSLTVSGQCRTSLTHYALARPNFTWAASVDASTCICKVHIMLHQIIKVLVNSSRSSQTARCCSGDYLQMFTE